MKNAIVVAVWLLVAIGLILVIKNADIKYAAKQRAIAASDSVRKEAIIDSLSLELFQAQSETGRYEMTLEHLKETNPKAAKEFEQYFDNQTE